MSIARRSLIASAVIVLIAISIFYFSSYFTQREALPSIILDGVTWSQVLHWNFKDGFYPNDWSWGSWNIVDGTLEGRDPSGEFSVYFFPFSHGGNFTLETKVTFVQGTEANDVNAQLLTRDSNKLNFESGLIAFAKENRVTVRHMVNKINCVYETFYIDMDLTYGESYLMRFTVYSGTVKAFMNDIKIYSSKDSYPVGEYKEPHLAVQYGIARFEYVKIFIPKESPNGQYSLEYQPRPFSYLATFETFKRIDSESKLRVDSLSGWEI